MQESARGTHVSNAQKYCASLPHDRHIACILRHQDPGPFWDNGVRVNFSPISHYSHLKERIPMRNITLFAVACIAAPAFGQVEAYNGTRISNPVDTATFCCLNTGDPLNDYQEAGLSFRVNDTHFSWVPCGFPNSEMFYVNGGVNERVTIDRLDGGDFGRIEMNVSDGWFKCDNYIWVTPFKDGEALGDFALDSNDGGVIGVEGDFDQIRIAAYFDAATRDQFNETGFQAIAFDNVAYEDGGANLRLAFSGNCPGTGTFDVIGATPSGNVALVYGFGDGPTTIPNTFPCAGTVLNVGNPNLDNRVISADANGNATFSTFIPAAACGAVKVQALDLGSCAVSNVVNP